MKDKNDEELEQLKRDLKSYGSYNRRIRHIESELYNITQQIHDAYEASGVGYGEPMSSSNPKHPFINQLQYEEADLILNIKKLKKKRSELGIDDKLKLLNEIQYEVIESLYFYKSTFRNATIVLNRSKRSIEHNNNTALAIMLKS